MTFFTKTIISIVLSLLLGVGGYLGTRLIITGGDEAGAGAGAAVGASVENASPRDNTGYSPTSFSWSGTEHKDKEDSHFLAGKYVREDGNAVMYIDYDEDSARILTFPFIELFVMKTQEHDELRIDKRYITILPNTGRAGYDYDELILMNVSEGVIKVTVGTEGRNALEAAEGTYYIVRAKYGETPNPLDLDESHRLSGNPQNGTTQGGTTQGDTQGGDGTEDKSGTTQGGGEEKGGGDEKGEIFDPKDPVGETAKVRGDGEKKKDRDIVLENPEQLEDFEKINDIKKDPINTEGIGTLLQGKHFRFTGESMVRWDYKLDRGTFRNAYKEAGARDDQIDALLDFSTGGGFVGDLQKVIAEFVFGEEILVKFDMDDGPQHIMAGRYTTSKTGINIKRSPVAVRDLVWDSKNGYLWATFYDDNDYDDEYNKTMSVSLQFGRDPDGTIVVQGWCFAADFATTRTILSIRLYGEEIERDAYEGVWVSEGDPNSKSSHAKENRLMEIRSGQVVRFERDGALVAHWTGNIRFSKNTLTGEQLMIIEPSDGGMGVNFVFDRIEGNKMYFDGRVYTRQSP
ncbi:MAG: hypothetical protein FWD44_09185 [Oscillospiraceae bacterium]|nr:hypothetical protein [Oscillospiraceae bacterium]